MISATSGGPADEFDASASSGDASAFPSRRGVAPNGPEVRGAANRLPDDLEHWSKDELYAVARRLKIEGRCRMSRDQLLAAIVACRTAEPDAADLHPPAAG